MGHNSTPCKLTQSTSVLERFNINTSIQVIPEVTKAPFTTAHNNNLTQVNHLSIEQQQIKQMHYSKTKNATAKVSMSERQREWFLLDKRLIFACNSSKDFALWITKLEGLIQ